MPLLTCPHCGNALTAPTVETAPLRCPVCGALLSPVAEGLPVREAVVIREEDDSATQAVARERIAPILASAERERQGAPRAPTAPFTDETTKATSISPISAEWRTEPSAKISDTPDTPDTPDAHETTQALPLSALPQQTPQESSRGRLSGGVLRALSVALIALTLVAVVAVAAFAANGVFGGTTARGGQPTATAASPTASPSATPSATPDLVAFSLSGLYQIGRPRDWLIKQINTPPKTYYALLTAPTGGASVNIEAQQSTSGAIALDSLDEQFLRALAQTGATPQLAGSPTNAYAGGQVWTRLAADMPLRTDSGQPSPQYAHVVALSTQRGSYVYTIVYLAPTADEASTGAAFTMADNAYFQPMLASFTFLG